MPIGIPRRFRCRGAFGSPATWQRLVERRFTGVQPAYVLVEDGTGNVVAGLCVRYGGPLLGIVRIRGRAVCRRSGGIVGLVIETGGGCGIVGGAVIPGRWRSGCLPVAAKRTARRLRSG
ncbi:hypothetical protein ACOJBO_25455 [Rhizobium beringeri]